MSDKLYIELRPASQLYLATSDAPELILKSVESPELFLKAKYTRRTGSPGNYNMRHEARYNKSQDSLYLDLSKANDFRDPSQGQYIAGGAVKAKTQDLSETLSNLMNQLPGEELDKD
jgi:hypothetical protein